MSVKGMAELKMLVFGCLIMMTFSVLVRTSREVRAIEASMPVPDDAAYVSARSENCAMSASDLAYALDPRFWSRERARKVYRECMGK